MANPQHMRRRITGIRNTSQITKAMQMVAASKMRRAQQAALAGRPYASLMNKVLVSLQQRTDAKLHPLLAVREVKRELAIVISTDKGLAGALNTNLMREAIRFDQAKTVFVSAGKKGRQFLARSRRELLADFELRDAPIVQTQLVVGIPVGGADPAAEMKRHSRHQVSAIHRFVRQRVLDMLTELVRGYAVDGVIFDDRLRYAGINADFSEETRNLPFHLV